MRRMYSEQELAKIVKEVSEAYINELIEDGEFDQEISDYVDAYLVEHPVDITALNGQTITPAIVNATTAISAPEIIETMSGYSLYSSDVGETITPIYYNINKIGDLLNIVFFGKIVHDGTSGSIGGSSGSTGGCPGTTR